MCPKLLESNDSNLTILLGGSSGVYTVLCVGEQLGAVRRGFSGNKDFLGLLRRHNREERTCCHT